VDVLGDGKLLFRMGWRAEGGGVRRALVTGASRGIGRALVTELVARGLEVVVTARRADDLASLAGAERLQLDVTSDASIAAAAELAGPVDLLVNNAAISAAATVEDTPAAVALAMFDTNVAGPLRVISAFVPGMRERGGGTVVNVSSAAGQAVFALNGVHAASKHALEALSEALAMEAGPFGIRVLVVQLGGVATGMYQNQQRYISAAYDHLHRAQQDAFQDVRAQGASPEQAARAIADAIDDTSSPLRVPIGNDATWILAERARLDDTAWIARVRELTSPPSKRGVNHDQ
jgi:NAD(P)-dependent dehydrogenase (short-subunit alcohol dehydrogenase family)